MKKIFLRIGSMCIAAVLLAGCGNGESGQADDQKMENTETESEYVSDTKEIGNVTKLIWQNEQQFSKNEKYFNQILRKKGLPFEVEFIEEAELLAGRQADLKNLSWTWEYPCDLTEEVLEGSFLALDEYLDSEEGKAIKDALPKNVWDIYQTEGKQYTVPSVGFLPTKTVYIWDTELAEKYDVHPDEWNENIWEYEEELQKVCEGEKETKSFITLEGARWYSRNLKGMTNVLGSCYPFIIRESDKNPRAEFLYETSEYQEYLAGMQSLLEKGIYDPVMEENLQMEKTSFLKIDADFKTKDAYAAWQADGFWDTHEVKEIWQKPLWKLGISAHETGITVESEHPKEAFLLLCRLYDDAELINALMWGEEGRDYELHGNTAEKPMAGGYIPAKYVGNNFLAYAEVGQDENKKELYPRWLEESENSKLAGFEFSGKACEEELQNLYQLYSKWEEKDGRTLLEENDALIRECKQAGADRVLEEWNRQYQEWNAE